MLNFREMDSSVAIREQLADESAEPVVLVNVFTCAPEDLDRTLAAWEKDAQFFRAQPGFISTQLHRGTSGSTALFNYAVWESVGHFRAAFGKAEFKARLADYPDSATGSPHLFRKLAVPGICIS